MRIFDDRKWELFVNDTLVRFTRQVDEAKPGKLGISVERLKIATQILALANDAIYGEYGETE